MTWLERLREAAAPGEPSSLGAGWRAFPRPDGTVAHLPVAPVEFGEPEGDLRALDVFGPLSRPSAPVAGPRWFRPHPNSLFRP